MSRNSRIEILEYYIAHAGLSARCDVAFVIEELVVSTRVMCDTLSHGGLDRSLPTVVESTSEA